MKKIYKNVEIEIHFYLDDVITTSEPDDRENFGDIGEFSPVAFLE